MCGTEDPVDGDFGDGERTGAGLGDEVAHSDAGVWQSDVRVYWLVYCVHGSAAWLAVWVEFERGQWR